MSALAFPDTTTPEALAGHMGWSPRRVRKFARDLGACRIVGNRMSLTREDVIKILESQGAETSLLTMDGLFPSAPATPEPAPSIHTPKQGYIYFIECSGFIKIGYSTDPRGRLSNLTVSSPFDLVVLGVIEGTEEDECDLHKRFAAHRHRGEWFRLSPEIKSYIEIMKPKT